VLLRMNKREVRLPSSIMSRGLRASRYEVALMGWCARSPRGPFVAILGKLEKGTLLKKGPSDAMGDSPETQDERVKCRFTWNEKSHLNGKCLVWIARR